MLKLIFSVKKCVSLRQIFKLLFAHFFVEFNIIRALPLHFTRWFEIYNECILATRLLVDKFSVCSHTLKSSDISQIFRNLVGMHLTGNHEKSEDIRFYLAVKLFNN